MGGGGKMLFPQFFSSKLLMLQQGFGNIFRENSCSSLCLSSDKKKKKKKQTRRLPEIFEVEVWIGVFFFLALKIGA